MSKHQELLKDFGYVAQSARTLDALMDGIAQRLHDTMTRYNWVGFYLVDKARPGSLNLGRMWAALIRMKAFHWIKACAAMQLPARRPWWGTTRRMIRAIRLHRRW